jgi:Spy/CpxP family protein refolding chaperone
MATMKGRFNLRSGALWILLGALLLLPPLHQAQAKAGGWEQMKEKIQIIKELHELQLTPDNTAALLALDQRYAKERKSLMGALKKYREDLQAALATSPANEAKVKDLVSAAKSAQDKLLTSIQMERDEALALLNPTQQGQLFMLMDNWLQQKMKKS